MASHSEITSGYASSDSAKIYFESAGSGANLLFLHAGVSDRRMWDPQFEVFSDRFRVVRYDHRGFGKSKLVDEAYSLRGDLLSVARHLKIQSTALIGCSMGGAAAIDFTLEHPEMVTALVLVGSGASGLDDAGMMTADALTYTTEMMRTIQNRDFDGAREVDAKYWIDGPSRDAAKVGKEYRERARELHRENFSLERFKHPELGLKPPAIGRLGEIKAPTLIIIGDSDETALIKLADRFAAEIPNARLARIANAAHLPSLEHPVEFNRLVLDFLLRAI